MRGVEGDRRDVVGDGVVDELVGASRACPRILPTPDASRARHPFGPPRRTTPLTTKLRFALYGVLAALAGDGRRAPRGSAHRARHVAGAGRRGAGDRPHPDPGQELGDRPLRDPRQDDPGRLGAGRRAPARRRRRAARPAGVPLGRRCSSSGWSRSRCTPSLSRPVVHASTRCRAGHRVWSGWWCVELTRLDRAAGRRPPRPTPRLPGGPEPPGRAAHRRRRRRIAAAGGTQGG